MLTDVFKFDRIVLGTGEVYEIFFEKKIRSIDGYLKLQALVPVFVGRTPSCPLLSARVPGAGLNRYRNDELKARVGQKFF